MAFNPFSAFRKHQKVIYAALTIVCMFTFVASAGISGRGDFFGEMAAIVGMRTNAPAAATLAGKNITEPEFKIIRYQRLVANRFMATAVRGAGEKVLSEVLTSQNSPLDQSTRTQILRLYASLQNSGAFGFQFALAELAR